MRCTLLDGLRETDGKSAAPRAMRCHGLSVAPLHLPKRRRRHNRTTVAKGWLQALSTLMKVVLRADVMFNEQKRRGR